MKPTFFFIAKTCTYMQLNALVQFLSSLFSRVKMSINYHCANFFSLRCVICKSSENRKKSVNVLIERTTEDCSSSDRKREQLTC